MKARSIKGKSTAELKENLTTILSVQEQSGEEMFRPTLAIVFASKIMDRDAITTILDDRDIEIFGCTTNGEFIDEKTEKGSAAMLLLDLAKDYFQIYFEEYPDKNYKEVASGIAHRAKSQFGEPAFLLSISHMEADGEEILHGFEEVIGEDVNVFGGSAGDDYAFEETFVFTNDKDSNNGMVCLALDQSKIEFKGIATCGWKAVGTERTVTRSEGNHVYTVDDIPVLDITTKYGGLENITPENDSLLMELAANFPLQLQREEGDPVMRPGLVVDWSDHSFYTGGTVPQGSKVRFSLPPDFDVMEKVVTHLEKLKALEMPSADALIVFSCAGRILSLGPLMTEEIEGVKNVWNVPMAGMFSNAEFGRATGGNLELHNLTTCCVVLKEKTD